MWKKCNKCGKYKALWEYYGSNDGVFGIRAVCKNCTIKRDKQYRQANKTKIVIRNKKYRSNNKIKIIEYNKQYCKANKDRIVEYQKQYHEVNKEDVNKKHRKYHQEHKEEIAIRSKKYRSNNKEKLAEYRKNNKDKRNTINAKRRANKLNQTPVLTQQELQDITLYYTLAQQLTELGSTKYHVDHIIPLSKGGLHHPDNLQVLTQRDNLCKSTKLNYKYKDEVYKL